MDTEGYIKAGIFGVVTGDALGVPVEFQPRERLKANPVTDMREYGTHRQPKGTWSDDSSMMLATLDSMIDCRGIQYDDIMGKFVLWRKKGKYTPYGEVFDIGLTCADAIDRYGRGFMPLKCGGTGERDNGNGSLMRIMPISLFYCLKEDFWDEFRLEKAVMNTHAVSCLTHGHPRSQMACMIYTAICHELAFRGERSVLEAVQTAVSNIMDYYAKAKGNKDWCDKLYEWEIDADTYKRIKDLLSFSSLPEEEIKSSGYVVHTLEAAIWCLLNSESFTECVLKAVNLGGDTDTVGAVAGGLAGLCYGYESIPCEWVEALALREWIDGLCTGFSELLLAE